nr:helix-turn-helix domain-containing protein [uncultured Flavobacterium sp.]
MHENKKYTILSLVFECGFNSKFSFNKYFKKVTNMTPSEY